MLKEKYLIIDDDKSFGNKLKESFAHRGINAEYAENIETALAYLKNSQIHRVILDLKLDQDNGLNFLDHINLLSYDIQVLILTGYGSINTVKLALKKGAVNYLQKPANVEEIIRGFDSLTEETQIIEPTLENLEKDYINRVLVDQKGNISKSAKILGLHRRSLQRKLNNT